MLEKHILGDSGGIADRPLADLRRRDVLDLRSRVLAAASEATANTVIGILKICFKEALFREEFERDPTAGIGLVGYQKAEQGTFAGAELEALFPAAGRGPWGSELALTCFLLTAACRLRRGEVLALLVRDVDLEKHRVRVERVWKDHHEEGDPKWDSKRGVPFLWQADRARERLKAYMISAKRIHPEDLLFCYQDGERLGETWWRKTWLKAMGTMAEKLAEKKVSFDWAGRRLAPHSLRHTLNTMLLDAGKDPVKMRAALGWTQAKTQEGYTHWAAEHLEELRLG